MRQRKLLLPAFHGEAVQRYVEMIADVARQEIDHWPLGEPFALAPRMQAVTLEVIMRGVFGVGRGVGHDDGRAPHAPGAAAHARRLEVPALPAGGAAQRAAPRAQGSARRGDGDGRPPDVRGHPRAPRAPPATNSAATSCRCCSPPATRRASRSPTMSCATSSCRWCWPATRRPPTHWRGSSSGCCARRSPTTACASWCAPAIAWAPRSTSRRRSTRACATGR